MNIHYITKPNFKPHPLNYFFMVVFFLLGFLPASDALAVDRDRYIGSFFGSATNYCNEQDTACVQAIANRQYPLRFSTCETKNDPPTVGIVYGQTRATGSCGYMVATAYTCPEAAPNFYDGSCKAEAPPPPEPENCTDLAGQTSSVRSGNLSLCISGCLAATGGGVTVQIGDTKSLNTYTYTGGTCNATPNVPWQEQYKDAFDGTDHQEPDESQVQKDDEGQHNCYTVDGKYLGRVSIKVNCPTDQQRCYDTDTGKFTNTIGPGQSCATGATTKEAADRDTLKRWHEESITNPDGSTTKTTTGTKEETGVDGSKHTTTTTTTGGKNADGSDKPETTTTKKSSSGSGAGSKGSITGTTSCTAKPKCSGDVLQCAQIQLQWLDYCTGAGAKVGGLDSCTSEPTCDGDLLQCAQIRQAWAQSCKYSDTALTQALADPSFVAAKAGATLDESGGLSGIYEQVDVNDALNLGSVLGDNGRSGSCPSDVPLPFSMATQYFKYDSICQMMDALRPLVLFAAAFFCVMMIYRGIVEQT